MFYYKCSVIKFQMRSCDRSRIPVNLYKPTIYEQRSIVSDCILLWENVFLLITTSGKVVTLSVNHCQNGCSLLMSVIQLSNGV